MLIALAVVLMAIFALLGLLHLYWASGGQYAKVAAIPELRGTPAFLPGRMATLLVAAALLACVALIAAAGGFIRIPLSSVVIQRSCFGLSLVLLLRAIGDFRLLGFFKTVRGSRFAWLDTALYSPLCLFLAMGLLMVGWKAD